MDYYKLSEEPLLAAKTIKKQGLYRMSVTMATLAAEDFINYAETVKNYVDTACLATLEDLQNRFNK